MCPLFINISFLDNRAESKEIPSQKVVSVPPGFF